MTRDARDDLRSAALDAYLAQRETDGYEVETNVVTVGRSAFVGTGAGIVRVPASECAP